MCQYITATGMMAHVPIYYSNRICANILRCSDWKTIDNDPQLAILQPSAPFDPVSTDGTYKQVSPVSLLLPFDPQEHSDSTVNILTTGLKTSGDSVHTERPITSLSAVQVHQAEF
jgi:hypothetical protein